MTRSNSSFPVTSSNKSLNVNIHQALGCVRTKILRLQKKSHYSMTPFIISLSLVRQLLSINNSMVKVIYSIICILIMIIAGPISNQMRHDRDDEAEVIRKTLSVFLGQKNRKTFQTAVMLLIFTFKYFWGHPCSTSFVVGHVCLNVTCCSKVTNLQHSASCHQKQTEIRKTYILLAAKKCLELNNIGLTVTNFSPVWLKLFLFKKYQRNDSA